VFFEVSRGWVFHIFRQRLGGYKYADASV